MSKSKTRKIRPSRHNPLPKELDEYLADLAEESVGQPLSEMLGGGDHPLKALIGRIVELSLEAEMTEHLGYDRHQRQDALEGHEGRRANTRNGHSSKNLKTSYGSTTIEVPRDRQGEFEPRIVPKHKGMTDELEQRILSMYSRGMTTSDIAHHVAELYHIPAHSMMVSRVVQAVEPELKAWRNRPLASTYAIVFIDAFHVSIRHSHGVESTAIYTACGYGEDGVLEVLALEAATEEQGRKESASFWHQVLLGLKHRGLSQALIVCADGLTGLERAVDAVWPNARFVPCVVHMVRASCRYVSYADRKSLCKWLRAIYNAPTFEAAELALEELHDEWGSRHPTVVRQWRENLVKLAQLWSYDTPLRKLVYTTNPIENVNGQVRKVSKNRGVFPNLDAALRLFSLVLSNVDSRSRGRRARPDWRLILAELHIHFEDQLDPEWGWRVR